MSVKAKIAAGAATFGLVGGGLAMAGTMTASAATPNCGANCTSIFAQKYGPQYLIDVYQARAAAGTPVILFQRSNSDPAEDFVVTDLGTVHSFYKNHGLVTSAFDVTYRNDEAYEVQYEPYGLNSNFCLSTWSNETPQAGYKVRLEPCGQYSNSIWAADTDARTLPAGDSIVTDHRSSGGVFSPVGTDVALINGATNTFSNPLVLNYPAGNPTDMPRPQLNVQPEKQYSDGTTFDNQEWGTVNGPVR
ncbi:MAG TPA: hypothetical protein VH089_21330 [Streptosporangiaceae bacterium]|jgi:hypothetical protein|nr:hypothetical protein [Streptosporangiaceae bacterium]